MFDLQVSVVGACGGPETMQLRPTPLLCMDLLTSVPLSYSFDCSE